MYSGKNFEDDFRNSFRETQLPLLTRLYDTTNGFAGVKNPCDFIVYNSPYQMMLELKVTHSDRLPFDSVTVYQQQQLTARDKIEGIMAGLLICYYNQQRVFFVPMTVANKIRAQGPKSLHFEDAERYGIEVSISMKRVRFTVDIDKLLADCRKYRYDFDVTEVVKRGKA